MRKIMYILYGVVALMLTSCGKDGSLEDSRIELIKSVRITPKSNNVLRFDINIEFNQAVRYHIEYWKSDDEISKQTTKPKESDGSTIETLILLEPETHYMFKLLAYSGSHSTESDIYDFTTDALPADLLSSMTMEKNKLEKEPSGYILQMQNLSKNHVAIFNMKGIMVWYQDMGRTVSVVNFDAKTNTIACLCTDFFAVYNFIQNQEIVIMDLMGKRLLSKEYNNLYAHHDIRRMPDGNILIMNAVPKAFDLTEHGGKVDDIVWGDGYTIMDMWGEIKYQWDCFKELNPRDDPKIMDSRGDWLHANSVNFDSEGNIYMSFNWSNELWKIDKESGDVLYRIGRNGNINIPSSGYTSGIHALIPLEPNKILLLDNGNDKKTTRAMIYSIDEEDKKVKINLDVPFTSEYYTHFMGNVEIIDDNLLMFNSSNTAAVVFTDYKGNIARVLKLKRLHSAYRSVYIPEINY